MDILLQNFTPNQLAILIGVLGLTIIAVIAILKWQNKTRQKESLSFESAKDVLKFIPIEAEFSIILRYQKTKDNTVGIKTQNIDYYLQERRKVYVSFDFSEMLENKDNKQRTITLSRLPEPKIEIDKFALEIEDKTLSNKTSFFSNKNGEVDTDVILKVRNKAVAMLKTSAENSGIKEVAKKKLNERIDILQKAAAKQGWKIQVA